MSEYAIQKNDPAPDNPADIHVHETDYLVRFVNDEFAGSEWTQTVIDSLATIYGKADFAIDTLRRAVESMYRGREYQSHYTAFLLGQIDEEKFEEVSATFVVEPQHMDQYELARRIQCLAMYTSIELTPGDAADIFECDQDVVESVWPALTAGTE